jgi:Xaa-Pro dipeptidase
MSRTFDRNEIQRRRVEQLLGECMSKNGIDLWLVYTRESSRDPLAQDVGLGRVVARAAGIFARKKGDLIRRAYVASYDTTPVEESGIFQEVLPFRQEGITPSLREAISALAPKKVALNFSRDIAVADGLSYGMRQHLVEILGEGFFDRVVSSEPLVASFRCRKLPEELDSMRRNVIMTQEVIARALSPEVITPGVTRELDVGRFLEESVQAQGATVAFTQVMVGPCRGHADPSELVIKPGDLIRIDFGAFVDGYSSDIQRTAYVLREGETEPPAALRRLFDVTLAANRAGIAALRPGATGLDVDSAARAGITSGGYEEYPHATGHPIGLETHELGPILGPAWRERYGTSVEHHIEPGMVFAVEPAAYVDIPECGGVVQVGLEEDVEVTPGGPRIIGTPQEELIILQPRP